MIYLAIPNTGTIKTELMEWVLRNPCNHMIMPQLKPHDHNRNYIVQEFLKTDCTHLMMIDSDVVPVSDVRKMVDNDVDICSAHVCTRLGNEIIPVGMTKNENGYHHDFKHSKPDLHKVDAVGTGCIMIHRRVFEKLEKPYFKFVYNDDGMLICGEDFYFSNRIDSVYFDSRFACKHFTVTAI